MFYVYSPIIVKDSKCKNKKNKRESKNNADEYHMPQFEKNCKVTNTNFE